MLADRIVAAVRACVGTRFRAQGRVPGLGLDCVGVVLVAAAAAGVVAAVPAYALGGDHAGLLLAVLAAHGCVPVQLPSPGDILVLAPDRRHRHLAVATPEGVVHAHAGLGRVVEGPIDSGWAIIGAWRLPRSGERLTGIAAQRLPRSGDRLTVTGAQRLPGAY
ncbi:MAG: peptidoglycan endopeptidase [Polymorphobacter sp.]